MMSNVKEGDGWVVTEREDAVNTYLHAWLLT